MLTHRIPCLPPVAPDHISLSSAGAGVFRFQNGSLLIVKVMDGSGCVNLTAGNAALAVNYEITGGTGRFTDASGESHDGRNPRGGVAQRRKRARTLNQYGGV